MAEPEVVLFEDRRNGKREARPAASVPESIRVVQLQTGPVTVARIVTFEEAERLVIERYDAQGRQIDRTVSRS